jgi:hypothetical protein
VTTNETLRTKEISISNDRKIIGKSKFKITFKDSISKELGIKELPVQKLLFYTKEHSFVSTHILEPKYNGNKILRRYIIRIKNSFVDFNQSNRYNKYFDNYFFSDSSTTIMIKENAGYLIGFGEFTSQDLLKYNLENFSSEQKNSILLGMSSVLLTSTANAIYLSSSKNPKLSVLFTINAIGGGLSIFSFAKYLGSYKYINQYNQYKEAIPLEEMRF